MSTIPLEMICNHKTVLRGTDFAPSWLTDETQLAASDAFFRCNSKLNRMERDLGTELFFALVFFQLEKDVYENLRQAGFIEGKKGETGCPLSSWKDIFQYTQKQKHLVFQYLAENCTTLEFNQPNCYLDFFQRTMFPVHYQEEREALSAARDRFWSNDPELLLEEEANKEEPAPVFVNGYLKARKNALSTYLKVQKALYLDTESEKLYWFQQELQSCYVFLKYEQLNQLSQKRNVALLTAEEFNQAPETLALFQEQISKLFFNMDVVSFVEWGMKLRESQFLSILFVLCEKILKDQFQIVVGKKEIHWKQNLHLLQTDMHWIIAQLISPKIQEEGCFHILQLVTAMYTKLHVSSQLQTLQERNQRGELKEKDFEEWRMWKQEEKKTKNILAQFSCSQTGQVYLLELDAMEKWCSQGGNLAAFETFETEIVTEMICYTEMVLQSRMLFAKKFELETNIIPARIYSFQPEDWKREQKDPQAGFWIWEKIHEKLARHFGELLTFQEDQIRGLHQLFLLSIRSAFARCAYGESFCGMPYEIATIWANQFDQKITSRDVEMPINNIGIEGVLWVDFYCDLFYKGLNPLPISLLFIISSAYEQYMEILLQWRKDEKQIQLEVPAAFFNFALPTICMIEKPPTIEHAS